MKLDLLEGEAMDGNLDIFENLTAAVGSEKLDAENIRLVTPTCPSWGKSFNLTFQTWVKWMLH